MEQFLKEDHSILSYYIKKYCPSLPYKAEYIEPKLKPILERLAKTDPHELNLLFWPHFDESDLPTAKHYDQQFKNIMEKKGLQITECSVNVSDDDEPFNFNVDLSAGVRLVYAVKPGEHFGYLVNDNVDDKEYFDKASIIMDDLYKSSPMEELSVSEKKKALMNLMRFIDSTRYFVEKTWPKLPVTEELLKNLQDKYDIYDELYDEYSIMAQCQ